MMIAVFLVYSVAVMLFGIIMSKGKDSTGADFLLAGRSLPFVLLLGTMFATIVGTGSSMGSAGLGYSKGFGGAIYLIAAAIGILATGLLYSNMRQYSLMTMPEEAAIYYGGNKFIRGLISIVMSLSEIGWLAVHIIGAATYIQWILGIPQIWSRILATAIFGVYVIVGGYLAVVWTDLIQGIILGSGFLVAAFMGVKMAGGWAGIAASVPKGYFSIAQMGAVSAAGLFVAQLLGPMAMPVYRQRIYSAESESAARKSFLVSALICVVFAFLPVTLGMAAKTINPGLERADFAFPYMLTNVFSPFWGALFLCAGISATASSADSDTAAAVSLLINDVYRLVFGKSPDSDSVVPISRVATIIVLVFALVAGLAAKQVIDMIVMVASTVNVGLATAMLMGRVWKRATWQGATASIICGATASIWVMNSPALLSAWGGYGAIPAFIAALIGGVVVSLLTPQNTRTWEEVARELEEQRQSLEVRG